ncbi:superoxide dismutase-like [Tropilaelaps mercedesae]|uniref:Superoxide dismutase n=1 Tax=Tropilaelaps mercedesae TaxID=418985 RepID=A0A1V9XAK5_9ACAR|nr:superoxide dismutase-like [Tropilaelaps mercedesae]
MQCLFPVRSLSRVLSRGKATLPDLPYDYNALEPVISAEIMQLHHSKHHNAYVTNYNVAAAKLQEAVQKGDITAQVALQSALRFNGGGHVNHSIFWQNLCNPKNTGEPSADLLAAIKRDFSSLEAMKEKVSASAVGVQGSGWAWLGYNKTTKRLQVTTCPNQDPLEATQGLIPLFGIDVWEHAYYLQYKNIRPDYVKAIWKVANWKDISQRFATAQ